MIISLSDKTKAILRLFLFLGGTALIGFMLYLFFFARPPQIAQNMPRAQNTDGSLPRAGAGGENTNSSETSEDGGKLPPSQIARGGRTVATQLTQGEVQYPHPTRNGDVAYYDPTDGRFYTINTDGTPEALSMTQFPSAKNVTFDSNAEQAVIEFPDGSNLVYNFTTAQQITLPKHWEDFSFSNNGNEIVSKSIGNDPSNRALVITATDGSSTRTIAELGSNDDAVTVSWSPRGNIVGFSATGNGTSVFGQRQIYTITPDGEAGGVLTINGTNYQNIWSPSGEYLVYSIAEPADDDRPSLWYVDARGDRYGEVRRKLSVHTLAERCTFADEQTLYCGVPVTTPIGSGGNPEILTGPDHLYRINLTSGDAELVAIPAISTIISKPSLSEDGRNLYYSNIHDRLYTIRLR